MLRDEERSEARRQDERSFCTVSIGYPSTREVLSSFLTLSPRYSWPFFTPYSRSEGRVARRTVGRMTWVRRAERPDRQWRREKEWRKKGLHRPLLICLLPPHVIHLRSCREDWRKNDDRRSGMGRDETVRRRPTTPNPSRSSRSLPRPSSSVVSLLSRRGWA